MLLKTNAQNSDFVKTYESNFVLGDSLFFPVGLNCYYLQNLAASGKEQEVESVFANAKEMGVNVIRTWGFFDASEVLNPAVIQSGPGKIHETGLLALDYVIAKAAQYDIKLIIPLVNNWDDYGGMNQYVEWLSQETTYTKKFFTGNQIWIYGPGNRKYRYYITDKLTHDDFYTNTKIKGWYKYYLVSIMNRLNVYTKRYYKDEPAIMMWELANEPRSSDRTGEIVFNWIQEMGEFFKSVNTNHLLATGEEGFDISNQFYTGVNQLPKWFFDGNCGVSFNKNLSSKFIDAASIHLYSESWDLDILLNSIWLNAHTRISLNINKPIYLGEVGYRKNKNFNFDFILRDILTGKTNGVLLWQYSLENTPYIDEYSFNSYTEPKVIQLIKKYYELIRNKNRYKQEVPEENLILQNYPNPFNDITLVKYFITKEQYVLVELFNLIGERVSILKEGIHLPGEYFLALSGRTLPSGVYFVVIRYREGLRSIKILNLK